MDMGDIRRVLEASSSAFTFLVLRHAHGSAGQVCISIIGRHWLTALAHDREKGLDSGDTGKRDPSPNTGR